MIVARAKTSDFQLDRWIHSDWEQLRKRGVTVSSLARLIAVPRTTLRDALKKTERERQRQPERRGRPRALTYQQALRAGRRGSWWMHAQLFFFGKHCLFSFFVFMQKETGSFSDLSCCQKSVCAVRFAGLSLEHHLQSSK